MSSQPPACLHCGARLCILDEGGRCFPCYTSWKIKSLEAIKQQPTPHGSGKAIADLVCEDIQARKEFGTKKYGEPLMANNGRDALVDLYQELLDGVQYLKQFLEERKK